MEKIKAPIDEKNVSTDWIEFVVRSFDILYQHNYVVAVYRDCVVFIRWYDNVMEWKVSRDVGLNVEEAGSVYDELLGKLNEMFSEDDDGLICEISSDNERLTITQKFYFIN